MDVLTPDQRRRNMSAIKGKNTGPEMVVRRLVHALGYRYRLHRRDLPGRPDLVFGSKGKIIFVHGCYWHRHSCARGKPMPKTRHEFWAAKFVANTRRDRQSLSKLRTQGWEVLVVWECEVSDLQKLQRRLQRFLGSPSPRESRRIPR